MQVEAIMTKQYSILTMGQTYRIIESEDGTQWRPRQVHGYEQPTFATLAEADRAVVRLRKRELPARRRAVNEALHTISQIYWNTKSGAFEAIANALTLHGFEVLPSMTGLDRINAPVGDGLFLTLNIYRMESGSYEVVAYVN